MSEELKTREEIKDSLIKMYEAGSYKQLSIFGLYGDIEYTKNLAFRVIIDVEASKRNITASELIEYYADHPKEIKEIVISKELKETIAKLKRKDPEAYKQIKEQLETSLIKVSIHSQEQIFGKPPLSKQLSIFDDYIKDQSLIKTAGNMNIDILGWDLTRAEDQAVFAIQKIYSDYNYKGNAGIHDDKNMLIFTPAEFYESYGVKKFKSGNREVYSGTEKKQAFEALLNLNKKQCIVAYNELDLGATKKQGKQIFNRIETISSIIPEISFLYIGIDGKEIEELDQGVDKRKRLKSIKITPSKVLLSQIGSYYALLPANLYLELKEKLPRVKNKHLPNFIHWLATESALKKRFGMKANIEIGLDKLSHILRMYDWIKANRKSMINKRLKDCFKQAKSLNYLKDYKIRKGRKDQDVVELSINTNRFKPPKQIKKFITETEENKAEVLDIEEIDYGGAVETEEVKESKKKIERVLNIFKK